MIPRQAMIATDAYLAVPLTWEAWAKTVAQAAELLPINEVPTARDILPPRSY